MKPVRYVRGERNCHNSLAERTNTTSSHSTRQEDVHGMYGEDVTLYAEIQSSSMDMGEDTRDGGNRGEEIQIYELGTSGST